MATPQGSVSGLPFSVHVAVLVWVSPLVLLLLLRRVYVCGDFCIPPANSTSMSEVKTPKAPEVPQAVSAATDVLLQAKFRPEWKRLKLIGGYLVFACLALFL